LHDAVCRCCTAIKSDVEAVVPHHTTPSISTSSSSSSGGGGGDCFNQLPLSVVQTVTDERTAAQSQDRPMDYSLGSRWTHEMAVNGNAATPPGGR